MKIWIMTISLLSFAAIVYGLLIRDIRIHMHKKDDKGDSQ